MRVMKTAGERAKSAITELIDIIRRASFSFSRLMEKAYANFTWTVCERKREGWEGKMRAQNSLTITNCRWIMWLRGERVRESLLSVKWVFCVAQR